MERNNDNIVNIYATDQKFLIFKCSHYNYTNPVRVQT